MAEVNPTYRFAQLAGVASPDVTYVLDTNVISHVESMIRTADLSAPTTQQQKAISLAKVLADDSSALVVDDIALLEGSSFHNPDGLKASSVLIRDSAYTILRSSKGDLVGTISRTHTIGLPSGYDAAVRKQLDETLDIALWGVVPAYCAALLLEHRHKEGPVDRLDEGDVLAVLDRLARLLGFVPGTLWLTLLLACCGNQAARAAAMGVLKTGRATKKTKKYEPGKNALSAAWDLGTLQSLSTHLVEGRRLILVTEDKALAQLVESIEFRGIALHVTQDSLGKSDPERQRLERLQQAYARVRAGQYARIPTRQGAADAVRAVESEVGVSSPFEDALRHGVRLRYPARNFTSDDVDLVVAAVEAALAGDPLPGLERAAPTDASVADLARRLDAVLHLGLAAAQHTADRRRIPVDTILREGVRLLPTSPDGVLALLDLAGRDARPLTASARYDIVSRPDRLRLSVIQLVATVFRLVEAWALGGTREATEMVSAAASATRSGL